MNKPIHTSGYFRNGVPYNRVGHPASGKQFRQDVLKFLKA